MSFNLNDQKFSDGEIAQGVRQLKQERHDWCEQKAREFLATKPRMKFYHVDYFVPDVDLETHLRLTSGDIEKIQKALAKDLEEYGPYVDEEDEKDRRGDIICELELDGDYEIAPYGSIWIKDVDFNDYVYCYSVRAVRFDNQGNKKQYDDHCNVSLTDEEYIQVVTELLYAPYEISFDGLRAVLPEIGNKIWGCCFEDRYASALILDEINQDVNTILEQNGGRENTPHVGIFSNIFAQIAEYQASKQKDSEGQ